MTLPALTERITTVHRLRRDQLFSLRRPRNLCVRAERGTLWLTVDGDLADIELAPGESHRFDGPATVVVGTLGGDAVVEITATPAPAGPLRAWLRQVLVTTTRWSMSKEAWPPSLPMPSKACAPTLT